ncbi:MAG TPA: hypothetical protein VFJ62_00625 [Usitatibacter sp.]|nr:hypothetical protein [Usitatibacter sp.]
MFLARASARVEGNRSPARNVRLSIIAAISSAMRSGRFGAFFIGRRSGTFARRQLLLQEVSGVTGEASHDRVFRIAQLDDESAVSARAGAAVVELHERRGDRAPDRFVGNVRDARMRLAHVEDANVEEIAPGRRDLPGATAVGCCDRASAIC